MGDSYSIWATPSPDSPTRTRLQTLIAHISRRFETVPFEPHITVIGSVGNELSEDDVISQTAELCRTLRPYVCRVAQLAEGSIYWQCVYLRIENSEEIFSANQKAAAAFGLPKENTSGYMPHLSLIYADFNDEEREEVKNFIKHYNGDILINTEFLVNSFSLYRTNGNDKSLKTWKKLGEFELTG